MGKGPKPTQSRTWVWSFDSPPEAVWPLLADTARFNEAAKLPKQEIEERAREDGSVLYLARACQGPFALEWREKPVNWISNRWFEHCRYFSKGPLASLCARFSLEPDGAGCKGSYTIEAAPANLLGSLILRTAFFESAGRNFSALAESARDCAAGRRETPFDYQAPAPAAGIGARVEALVETIEASGHGHGLAWRLADFVLSAQEVDLSQLRPLRLARLWQEEPREVIELCLEATRAGLLVLRWDLLCPRCRTAKAVVGGLDALPQGAHCDTCNIDYERDFAKNVELSFRPDPAIRPISFGEYCLFGPMSTPHIHIHLTLAPGERRTVALSLPAGRYRLRTLEPGPELEVDWDQPGFPEVVAEAEAMRCGPAGPDGEIRLSNATARELTLIVEECQWLRDSLTADRVSALQAFRDLFSDQVLRPGDEVAIARVALMFTDLRGSTALYGKIGDAQAYHLVRDHFAFLTGIVRRHDGAIVKTIGDAIMAAFPDPAQAMAAALEIQREVTAFNEAHGETPVAIKLGLHQGPCIVVTLNERLDYFGNTVNMAARLQSESRGEDIVLSREMAEDPTVAPLLKGLACREEEASLKGFDAPVGFLRLFG